MSRACNSTLSSANFWSASHSNARFNRKLTLVTCLRSLPYMLCSVLSLLGSSLALFKCTTKTLKFCPYSRDSSEAGRNPPFKSSGILGWLVANCIQLVKERFKVVYMWERNLYSQQATESSSLWLVTIPERMNIWVISPSFLALLQPHLLLVQQDSVSETHHH